MENLRRLRPPRPVERRAHPRPAPEDGVVAQRVEARERTPAVQRQGRVVVLFPRSERFRLGGELPGLVGLETGCARTLDELAPTGTDAQVQDGRVGLGPEDDELAEVDRPHVLGCGPAISPVQGRPGDDNRRARRIAPAQDDELVADADDLRAEVVVVELGTVARAVALVPQQCPQDVAGLRSTLQPAVHGGVGLVAARLVPDDVCGSGLVHQHIRKLACRGKLHHGRLRRRLRLRCPGDALVARRVAVDELLGRVRRCRSDRAGDGRETGGDHPRERSPLHARPQRPLGGASGLNISTARPQEPSSCRRWTRTYLPRSTSVPPSEGSRCSA